jgi:hypothetical protein
VKVDQVFEYAKKIVGMPVPRYGYSDVGDVLVRYMRNEINKKAALESLSNLNIGYERDRARGLYYEV